MKKIKSLKIYNTFIINMGKYLSNYYNIGANKKIDLTHEELEILTGRKALSTNKIEPSKIKSGQIVLVKDCEEIIKGYKNPLINAKVDEISEQTAFIEIEEDELIIDLEKLDEFSTYELEVLIEECKKHNADNLKNKIVNILCRRTFDEGDRREDIMIKIRKKERNDIDD